MKVLIYGSGREFALEQIYIKHLKNYGCETILFPIEKHYFKNSLFGRIYNRIFLYIIHVIINLELVNKIKKEQPDILWVFKGVELYPATFKKIKKISHTKLINYNPDHPFIRVFRSGGGQNVEDCIPLYDLHFCYSKELCRIIQEKFNIHTVHLPFGFDLSQEVYEAALKESEVIKVAFVGNPDKYRKKIIEYLANNHISIDVYGYGWNEWIDYNQYITVNTGVEGVNFWKTLRKYRIQLNIFRPHNINSHNMRTFEIPAVGGIQLAPESIEHKEFFQENKEIFIYKDEIDLLEKTKNILNFSKDQADEIRKKSRKISVQNDYVYKNRANAVYQVFFEIIK